MPLVPSFLILWMGRQVCAPSNVHIQEADAVVQHNPCSSAAGQRGCSVEKAPEFFCPYYKTTVLNKPPSITLWLLSPTNYMIWKILQSCFEVHLLQQLSLSVFQTKSSLKSLWTQASGSGVLRDSCGKALPGMQGGSSDDPSTCTPSASHNLTAGYLTTTEKTLWNHHIQLVRPEGQAAGTQNHWPELLKLPTRWYSALKKFSAFFHPNLCPEPYCWPWSI